MVTLDEAVVARLKTRSMQFEVLVDPEKALMLKRGASVDLEELLAVEDVFTDASTGDRPSEEELIKVFGTSNPLEVAQQIIKRGEIQLTSEQRRRMLEEKKRKVIEFIARNAINPQTRAPHPPSRIEKAMEEAKVHIDPLKNVDDLVAEVMKAIKPIIPIRFEEIEIAVKFPPQYAAKAYGEIASFGSITKEQWQNDGSWIAVVKIPAGLQTDFYTLVNKLSKGEAITKLLK
ncbi:MAG: ribosome assembly factor SBDS [Methanocellales archaeon]